MSYNPEDLPRTDGLELALLSEAENAENYRDLWGTILDDEVFKKIDNKLTNGEADLDVASVSTESATIGGAPSHDHRELLSYFDISDDTSATTHTISDVSCPTDWQLTVDIYRVVVDQGSNNETNNFTLELNGFGFGSGNYCYLLEDETGSNTQRTGEGGWTLLETTDGTTGDTDSMSGTWTVSEDCIFGNGAPIRRDEGNVLVRGYPVAGFNMDDQFDMEITLSSELSDSEINEVVLRGAVFAQNDRGEIQ